MGNREELMKELLEKIKNTPDEVIEEAIDSLSKKLKEENSINKYEIKRIGNLSLCFNTYVNRKASWDEIEICELDEEYISRWTIMSFHKDKEGEYYIKSCGNRVIDNRVNWLELQELVKYGFKYLETEGE